MPSDKQKSKSGVLPGDNCFPTNLIFLIFRVQSQNKIVETQVIHTPLSTTMPMSIPHLDNPGKNMVKQLQYPNRPGGIPVELRGDLAGLLLVHKELPEVFQSPKMVH